MLRPKHGQDTRPPSPPSKGDNRWSAAVRDSLSWPNSVDGSAGALAIADSGNNRGLLCYVAP
jgi:hypothetical protein